MTNQTTDNSAPILVEFAARPGAQQVSIFGLSPEEQAERSKKALDSAMRTIHHMVKRVEAMIDTLTGHPDTVEVTFGLTLDVEGQALLAKASVESAMSIALTWERHHESGE